jgi:DNA (cytosine-5)-methyltransferase 1
MRDLTALDSGRKPNLIRVIELFAGVGGFRVGFERANARLRRGKSRLSYSTVWSNQWEPGERAQHASKIYEKHWGPDGHINQDLGSVPAESVPDSDLVVGGFPCQDYSVARTLNQAAGIVGKKGVLWWEIHRLTREIKPRGLLLENVDRLLNSPAGQRGRDFAIILGTLNALGYAVEWRVINAADYGYPQKRRRIFIAAYNRTTKASGEIERDPWRWIQDTGVLAKAFPATFPGGQLDLGLSFHLYADPIDITERFNASGGGRSPFQNCGVAINHEVYTVRAEPSRKSSRKRKYLKHWLEPLSKIAPEYFIPKSELSKWRFLKGAKSLERINKHGVAYSYDEGPIPFPDEIDRPARTIVTGEGGRTPSRFKHVIRCEDGRYRRLTPVELERLNGFKKNHTRIAGISDARRAFLMGNALVTNLVTDIAVQMAEVDALGVLDGPLGDYVQDPWSREPFDRTATRQYAQGAADLGLAAAQDIP